MTRKDYNEIAGIIHVILQKYKDDKIAKRAILEIIGELCGIFKQDNPRFDWDKFVKACTL